MGPMIVVLMRDRDLADLPVRGLYVIPTGLVTLCRCTEILLERALQLVEPLLPLTLGLRKNSICESRPLVRGSKWKCTGLSGRPKNLQRIS